MNIDAEKKQDPKVSVVIPTCNRPDMVARAVRSVLDQTYQDFEVIVVDDGLQKRADLAVRAISDPRVCYIAHDTNKGGSAARNTGIRAARGGYIAFLDDDDEWVSDKLEMQVKALDHAGNDVGFCFTAVTIDTGERKIRTIVEEGARSYYPLALSRLKGFLTVTLVIKRHVFEKVGIFDETFPSHQEAELMIRVAKDFKGLGINIPLVLVNNRDDHEHIASNRMKRIEGRLLLIKKHKAEFKEHPDILAKHYFWLALQYRNVGQQEKARGALGKAIALKIRPVYIKHYLLFYVQHLWKIGRKLDKALGYIRSGKFDLLGYKLASRFKNGILPPLPLWVVIEPVNYCNLRCPICPTGAGKLKRPKRTMGFEEFRSVIDQLKGYTDKVVLFNYGESYLNPDINRMVRYCVDAGMYVKISTNGTLLDNPQLCEAVVKSGLQKLIFSLDGADQHTIQITRIGADFNKIISSIMMIQSAKDQLNSITPVIELQFLVMKHNEHQRSLMRDIAKNLKVDIFVEKMIALNMVRSEFSSNFEKYLPKDSSMHRYKRSEGNEYGIKGELVNGCYLVDVMSVILSDGTVVPCCYDPEGDYNMGNIFKEEMKLIWKGRKYSQFRKAVRSNRKSNAICSVCSVGRCDEITRKITKDNL